MYKNVEYYSLNLMSRNLQSVTKIIETHYIFMKISKKNVRLAQRYPEFPSPLVQCCTESGKAMSGSGGQK